MSDCNAKRFNEQAGGRIYDGLTGKVFCRVRVEDMTTHDAATVIGVILAGLEAEYGPDVAKAQ